MIDQCIIKPKSVTLMIEQNPIRPRCNTDDWPILNKT